MSSAWIMFAIAVVGGIAFLWAFFAAYARSAANLGGAMRRNANGHISFPDTPAHRESSTASYDGLIAMEKRGHVNADGLSWNDRWLATIRSIRRLNENPEWYVCYIVEQRRAAGLPELEAADTGRPNDQD